MDHLLAINQLIGKSNEYQLDLRIGFIDYEKAFDSIEHPDLFQALREIGINEGYVCILEDIYTDATSRIHLDSDVSEIVKISRGVREGDTLSPKVFTAAMEEISKKIPLDRQYYWYINSFHQQFGSDITRKQYLFCVCVACLHFTCICMGPHLHD